MKNYKKLTLLLSCISACVCLFFIVETYAKYSSSATGNADIPIARWNIKVNNKSIKDTPDISSTLSPEFKGNDHIASNIIAPTATGYFDLAFDFTGADVSFKYDITISPNENSVVSDLVATGYSVDSGTVTNFTDGNHTISDTINYSDNIDSRTIRIYVMWDDTSDTTTMNNTDDALATTVANGSALIDVHISFTQTV